MAVLGLLNVTILSQADKQEEQNKIPTKQLKHMIEKEGASKNRIKSLRSLTIQMLLFISALDDDEIPNKLVESCKRILNSKTVVLAKQELNNQFKTHSLSEVSFLMEYIANLYLVYYFGPSVTLQAIFMMLPLTFSGAPCLSKWRFITESICNLSIAVMLSNN